MLDFSAHPLVETAWLAAHLSDGNVRIVDARWRGDGTSRELYQQGHLPGAVHLDWHRDLSFPCLLLLSSQPCSPFHSLALHDTVCYTCSVGCIARE